MSYSHWIRLATWIVGLSISLAGRADFYVAPGGSDENIGSKARPFATLERARDAVRGLKRDGKFPKHGFTIWLRGGDYLRTNALELTAEDSGTVEAPIVWQAHRNESARLLGGRLIKNFEPVTNIAVLQRLPEVARDQVVQADLRALGISDFGEMKSRGFGRPTPPAHCELFHGGKPMTLARWPNDAGLEFAGSGTNINISIRYKAEFTHIAGFPESSGKGDDHGGKIGELPAGFLYEGDRPRRWQNTQDLWVHGYWAWDWANSYERVASLDLNQRLIKTAEPHGLYGFRKGQRFYFVNVLEELDQPSEWFLDHEKGVLYFWPANVKAWGLLRLKDDPVGRTGFSMPLLLDVVLSTLSQPLIKLGNTSHVTFRSLVLEATRGNGIEIRGGASNRIAGCLIRNIGNNGVVIEGGTGHGVVSCDVLDTGDGGVTMMGGDRQTLAPGRHFVENCHFARQGRWSKCYVPAIHIQGVGLRASHNLIHDHPHCAILFWGNDHLIEFNDIHHIALETGDVGAIYTGRDYTFRGNKIRHNYIHETGGVGMGSMGVYMDDCVSGTEVFGNIFYKVHWAMFIGGGRDHRVENNIFVDCDPAVRADGRGLDKSPVWRNMVDQTMRQSLAAMPSNHYRTRYPEMKMLDAYYGAPGELPPSANVFNGVPPENNVIARNIAVGKWLEVGWHAKKEWFEVRGNFTDGDPRFVAREKKDFRLRKDSPVWKLGFQPIPVERIGLREDADRRALRRRTQIIAR